MDQETTFPLSNFSEKLAPAQPNPAPGSLQDFPKTWPSVSRTAARSMLILPAGPAHSPRCNRPARRSGPVRLTKCLQRYISRFFRNPEGHGSFTLVVENSAILWVRR